MTLEEVLYERLVTDTAIVGRVGKRIYRGTRPQASSLPCVVFQRVSTTPDNGNQGSVGVSKIRMQVDTYTTHGSKAREIATAIHERLDGLSRTSDPSINMVMLDSDQEWEEEARYGKGAPEWRISQDYIIWATA